MKRLFSILMIAVMALALGSTAAAGTPVKVAQLPVQVQKFVKNNFAPAKIVKAEKDVENDCTVYELKLSDGVEVEIGEDCCVYEVDAQNSSSAVPPAVVGEKIINYVITKYPGRDILKYEKDSRHKEVTLGDGTEIEFDLASNFIRVD